MLWCVLLSSIVRGCGLIGIGGIFISLCVALVGIGLGYTVGLLVVLLFRHSLG